MFTKRTIQRPRRLSRAKMAEQAAASFPNDFGGYPGFAARQKERRVYNTTPLTPSERFASLFAMFSIFAKRPDIQNPPKARTHKIIRLLGHMTRVPIGAAAAIVFCTMLVGCAVQPPPPTSQPASSQPSIFVINQNEVNFAQGALDDTVDALAIANTFNAFTPAQWASIQLGENIAQGIINQMQANVGKEAFAALQAQLQNAMNTLGSFKQSAQLRAAVKKPS